MKHLTSLYLDYTHDYFILKTMLNDFELDPPPN